MITYLNGRFLPEGRAVISVHDRGFLYGDSVFETVRVYSGEPFLWSEHMARLENGCGALRIALPFTARETRQLLGELLQRNGLQDALVRITVSRGIGIRGYSPKGADSPTFCMCVSPPATTLPRTYRLITSTLRLPSDDPLAQFKHGNKLRQVLARAEGDYAGADEVLFLNERGHVLEGTGTNIFWVEKGMICTPPLNGILPGITRAYVLELCKRLGIQTREKNITLKKLLFTEGVFVTSSAIEIVEVAEIDRTRLKRSPLVRQLKNRYGKVAAR